MKKTLPPMNGLASVHDDRTPAQRLGDEMASPMFAPDPAHRGESKRERMARSALQGILAGDTGVDHAAAADDAVKYADALLARLAR